MGDPFQPLLDGPIDPSGEPVCEALSEAGFDVLTEILVTATLKKKLGIDDGSYVLG